MSRLPQDETIAEHVFSRDQKKSQMDSIDAVMNTTEWRDASAATISRRANNHGEPLRICRRKVIARHMKLAAYLGALGEEKGAQDSQAMSAVNGCCGQPRKTAPFHPLHCAASQGMLDEGVILWEEAANQVSEDIINISDASGRTPLHWAAMTDRANFVHALLDNGAKENLRDLEGRTPLLSAAAFGALGAVRALLERGADKHGGDKRGLTPLHAAAAGGHIQVAAELLVAGADPSRRSRVGATPRHVAERQGHEAMVELLLMATEGADTSNHARRMSQLRLDWRSSVVRSE
ncbi:unnamed protein product [Ascophyllum nodosum]